MAVNSLKSLLDELSTLLALYKDYIGIQNEGKHFDINRLSEGVMAKLLTQLGGWGPMTVLEWDQPNHPAIDLLSKNRKVGVQVTSDKSATKVVETLKKFNQLKARPKSLYILMLRGRQKEYGSTEVKAAVAASAIKFSVDKHIVDFNFLYKLAEKNQDADRIEDANKCLKNAIGEWAIGILSRHRSAAGRLLRVLGAYGRTPTQILDLLGAQRKMSFLANDDMAFLNSLTTDAVLRETADQFQVPYDWIAGLSTTLGDIGSSCAWRGPGHTLDLLRTSLTRSRNHKATFHVVTPLEVEDLLTIDGDIKWDGKKYHMPILVYSATEGPYGTVYTHLGIQPGELAHYRQAACFLFSIIKKHEAVAPLTYSLHCRWHRWPRKQILRTASKLLLADAHNAMGASSYGEAYELGQLGATGWEFTDHPGWNDEFNQIYAHVIEKGLRQLEFDERAAFKKYHTAINDQIALKLPPESHNGIRVFGAEALRMADKCNVLVQVLRPDADAPVSMKFDDAVLEFMEYVGRLHLDEPPTVFYVDVVPEHRPVVSESTS